jgi:hypothetical protein
VQREARFEERTEELNTANVNWLKTVRRFDVATGSIVSEETLRYDKDRTGDKWVKIDVH